MLCDVFPNYDIITLQEVIGICSGELKEIMITLGQKAGFFYYAC